MTREIVVLVNPAAGWGRGARLAEPVAARLAEGGLTVRVEAGRDADDSLRLARDAVAAGVDGLLVVGGDGMAHLALQAVAGSGTALGVIPAGSGNDLARACLIPRRDPLAVTDLVIADQRRRIDLGRVGGTWFGTVLTAGFAASVAERVRGIRQPLGDLRYVFGVASQLRRWRPATYLLELDGHRVTTEAITVAVGNTRSFGGGVRICESADPEDGQFDVTVVGDLPIPDLVRVSPKLFGGRPFSHPAVSTYRARTVGLAAPGATAYADGERIGPLPLSADCVPGALQLFAPAPPPK